MLLAEGSSGLMGIIRLTHQRGLDWAMGLAERNDKREVLTVGPAHLALGLESLFCFY